MFLPLPTPRIRQLPLLSEWSVLCWTLEGPYSVPSPRMHGFFNLSSPLYSTVGKLLEPSVHFSEIIVLCCLTFRHHICFVLLHRERELHLAERPFVTIIHMLGTTMCLYKHCLREKALLRYTWVPTVIDWAVNHTLHTISGFFIPVPLTLYTGRWVIFCQELVDNHHMG